MPLMVPLLGALLALVLAAAAQLGQLAIAVVAVAVGALVAVGARRTVTVPLAEESTWLAIVGGSIASGLIVAAPVARVEPTAMTPMLVVLGLGLIVAVGYQLRRGDGREDLVGSLSYAVGVLLLATLPAAWVALGGFDNGGPLVWLCTAAIAAALAVQAIPLPRLVVVTAGLVVAALVGLWVVVATTEVDAELSEPLAMVVALVVAAAAVAGLHVGRRMAAEASVSARSTQAIEVALPLAFAGPIAFTAVWALT